MSSSPPPEPLPAPAEGDAKPLTRRDILRRITTALSASVLQTPEARQLARSSFPDALSLSDQDVATLFSRAHEDATQYVVDHLSEWQLSNNVDAAFDALDIAHAYHQAAPIPSSPTIQTAPDTTLPQSALRDFTNTFTVNHARRLANLIRERSDQINHLRRQIASNLTRTQQLSQNLSDLSAPAPSHNTPTS